MSQSGTKIATITWRMGPLTVSGGVTTSTQVAITEQTGGQKDVFKTVFKKSATDVKTADEGSEDFAVKLEFPVQVGTAWDGANGDTFEITEGPVAVTVPYGTIQGAYKVVHKMGTNVLDTTWYAPELGEVKTEGGDIKSELKEYTASGTAELDETTTAGLIVNNDEEATDVEEELIEE